MRPMTLLPICSFVLAITGANVAIASAETAVPALPAWMAGQWCSDKDNERIEEHWLNADGGTMLGVSRTRNESRKTQFEFMRIESIDGVPTFFAQPGGRPATAFPRRDGGNDWVRFENSAHDFPQRVEYRRKGNDLHAEISGPGDAGKTFSIKFEFSRCSS